MLLKLISTQGFFFSLCISQDHLIESTGFYRAHLENAAAAGILCFVSVSVLAPNSGGRTSLIYSWVSHFIFRWDLLNLCPKTCIILRTKRNSKTESNIISVFGYF